MNDFEFEVLMEMVNEMNQKLLDAHSAINAASTLADLDALDAANAEYKRVYAMIRALTESLEGEAE